MYKSLLLLLLLNSYSNTNNVDYNELTLDVNTETVMFIDGLISNEHVEILQKKQTKLKYLILNSPGGELSTSYSLASIVKYNNITTVIPPNGKCESACTIVFQAGKQRHASKASSLMYHGARLGVSFMNAYFEKCPKVTDYCSKLFGNMKEFIKQQTVQMFNILESYGLSHQVRVEFINQPIHADWFKVGNMTKYSDFNITAEESIKYNAVNRIVEYKIIK